MLLKVGGIFVRSRSQHFAFVDSTGGEVRDATYGELRQRNEVFPQEVDALFLKDINIMLDGKENCRRHRIKIQ